MKNINISPKKQEAIALEVIRVLHGELIAFPKNFTDNGNAPFHKAFLNVLKPKLDIQVIMPNFILSDSLLYDNNSELWQIFFEKVAHILSDGEKRDFMEAKHTDLKITTGQLEVANTLIDNLKNGFQVPSTIAEDRELIKASVLGEDITAPEFVVDNFSESESYIEAIEFKSIGFRLEGMQNEKRNILTAKAALKRKYPTKQIYYYFGFPFDPWSETATGYNKGIFLSKLVEGGKYLDPNEVLLAGELWDKLSGHENTMKDLLEIINSIATSEFMDIYRFLSDVDNIDNNRAQYIEKLESWGLLREKNIIENIDILRLVPSARDINRALRGKLFDSEGKYNINRYDILSSYL